MGYAKLRPRPANGNSPSSVLKPVSPKSYRGLCVGGVLLLIIGMVALCFVYKGDSEKDQSTETPLVVGTEIVNGIEWTYRVSDGKVAIGNGSSAAIKKSTTGAIAIPTKLGGYPVTNIGDGAFVGCGGLTSVTIPDGVTSIGRNAFTGCQGLRSVTIPDSVTIIGANAVSECGGLESISVAAGNKNYKSVNGLLLSKDGKTLMQGVNGDVTIPDSVTSIGKYAFQGCSGLDSVTIGNGVTSIGDSAFSGCSGLVSVTIPDSVTSIGKAAFYNCNRLRSVRLPQRLEGKFDRSAFGWRTEITYYSLGRPYNPELKKRDRRQAPVAPDQNVHKEHESSQWTFIGEASKRPHPFAKSIAKDKARRRLEAAEKGDVESMFEVGLCYYRGDGVEKDLSKAVKWWQIAADCGHAGAKERLSSLRNSNE